MGAVLLCACQALIYILEQLRHDVRKAFTVIGGRCINVLPRAAACKEGNTDAHGWN
jgi:hypothetical protein